jgi:hypothetical protein
VVADLFGLAFLQRDASHFVGIDPMVGQRPQFLGVEIELWLSGKSASDAFGSCSRGLLTALPGHVSPLTLRVIRLNVSV